MGDQQERVTIDGKEYVLASPNSDAKYQGLYARNGFWYRITDGVPEMVPMTTWQKFSTKEKVIYSTLALVLVFGAFALVSIATGGSSSSDGYGTGDTSGAKITLSGSCESGECDIRYDNETGGTDVIDGVPSIVQKFTVSNEEYEIYSISVRDGDRGEAKCSATIIVDQNVVDREEVTSNGTSAFCAVSTLIN